MLEDEFYNNFARTIQKSVPVPYQLTYIGPAGTYPTMKVVPVEPTSRQ